jgi:hypothetical protein
MIKRWTSEAGCHASGPLGRTSRTTYRGRIALQRHETGAACLVSQAKYPDDPTR